MTRNEPVTITSNLWDEKKAALYLSISHKTLQHWRCMKTEDQPTYIKIGRRVFYRQTDLDAFILKQVVAL